MNENAVTYTVIGLSIALACTLFYFASSNTNELLGVSVFTWCIVLAFILNWLAYIPAMLAQTEHYYDLTGSLTYLILIAFAVFCSNGLDFRSYLVATMASIWAIRLGTFLFVRVRTRGGDDRFETIKTQPLRFFMSWTIQALWVSFTLACVLVIITNQTRLPVTWIGYLGISMWLVGFFIEIIADAQKSSFNKKPSNNGKFINIGLWAWSQHPNYFGEILLWSGLAVIALPVLSAGQWVCLISPLFVFVLIRYISGVRLLEEKGQEKWGSDDMYIKYHQDTPLLIPMPPKVDFHN